MTNCISEFYLKCISCTSSSFQVVFRSVSRLSLTYVCRINIIYDAFSKGGTLIEFLKSFTVVFPYDCSLGCSLINPHNYAPDILLMKSLF